MACPFIKSCVKCTFFKYLLSEGLVCIVCYNCFNAFILNILICCIHVMQIKDLFINCILCTEVVICDFS